MSFDEDDGWTDLGFEDRWGGWWIGEDDGWGGWWVRMMDKTEMRVWGEWERGESTRVSFWERENG